MEKRPDNIVPMKSDKDTLYSDVKTAAQGGDNDTDRVASVPDEGKEETDKAYLHLDENKDQQDADK